MNRLFLVSVFVLSIISCKKAGKSSNEGCDIDKTIAENASKVTITQGVWGTCSLTTGNCQPIIEPGACITCPIKRTLQIYEYTKPSQAVISTTPPYYYDHFTTKKLAETTCDEKGFFEISIAPGKYSLVVVEDGKLYPTGVDGYGGLGAIEIQSNQALNIYARVSKAVY